MKLNEQAFAKAHAVLALGAFLLCAISIWLYPNLTLTLFNSWFHGVDITALPIKTGPLGSVLFGLVTFTAAGWLWGLVLAKFYNRFLK